MDNTASGLIRIIKVPEGQVPLWARQEWVGCTLPCHPVIGVPDEMKGVVDGRPLCKRLGAQVPTNLGLLVLHRKSPAAANYFYSLKLDLKGHLFFLREEFEIVAGMRMQRIIVADNMETGRFELPGR